MPKMTGQRFFAEAMRGYGVTHLFYINSILPPAMKEMESVGVKRVVTHGEKAAAYMADGYARASGRPGVCLSQDIGASNLLSGMRDAHMARVPVIAITGGQNDQPRYRNAYQNAEDFASWTALTKANFSVDTAARLPDLLRQAFRTATTGSPGPVHLEVRGNSGQLMNAEDEYDLLVEERFTHYPALRPVADASAIEAALDALDGAKKPIIVAGSGVVSSDAGAELVAFAQQLNIPVATSLRAKSAIADDHPLAAGIPGTYSRWSANMAVAAADLVFFIGSRTGGQVTNGWQVPRKGTRTIQLDIAAEELGRNYPNAVSLQGDAKATLAEMLKRAGNAPDRMAWLDEVKGYVRDFWAESDPLRESADTPTRPERLCKELGDWLPDDAVVVADTFHAAMWTAQMLRLREGQKYIACAGSLGWALPATLGAKCALPGRPVIGFMGDAGFYYHMAELETAARYGINAILVVNSNYSGGVVETVTYEPNVNIAKAAEALGCFSIRVERPEDIRGALDAAVASNRPALVEVITNREIRAKRGWVPPEISGE